MSVEESIINAEEHNPSVEELSARINLRMIPGGHE